MTNKLCSRFGATLFAGVAVCAGICVLTAHGQSVQPGQGADKTPSLASQFVFSLPDYHTVSAKNADKATTQFEEQRLRMTRLLLFQLREKSVPNSSKTEVIRLLGELHANEAIADLIENINYYDNQYPEGSRPTAIQRPRGYIARLALSEIGSPATQAILTITSIRAATDEQAKANPDARAIGFEPAKADGFAEVLIRVQGEDLPAARVALFQLQDRQRQAQDSMVKSQFQAVIHCVKVRLTQLQKAQ